MALYLNMKEALAFELGRYYRAWDWEDLQYGEVRPSTLFQEADAEVDFTYRGITRTVAYKRFNPNWFFANHPAGLKPVELEQDIVDPAEIATYLSDRYGVPFEAADIAPGAKLLAAPGQHVLNIAPNSPNYNANLTYTSSAVVNPAGDYDLGWRLNGDGLSSVEGGTALTAEFDYASFGGRQMATHKTDKNQALGVNIRAKGDFTFEFNIIPLDATSAKVKQGIFGVGSGDDTGQALSVILTDGLWSVICPGNRTYFNASAASLKVGKGNKITVRGINGNFELYNGKTLYAVVEVANQFDAWTHFGKAGEYLSDRTLISDICYWENATNMPVLQSRSDMQDVRMMHYEDHDWYISPANTASKTATRVNPAQLYYSVDFTPQAAVFKSIQAKAPPITAWSQILDAPTLTKLQTAIQAVDPTLTWYTANGRSINNLFGCWPMFNGKTKDFNDPNNSIDSRGVYSLLPPGTKWMLGQLANEEFDNVLCMLLDSGNYTSGTLRVPLLFHYNDEI